MVIGRNGYATWSDSYKQRDTTFKIVSRTAKISRYRTHKRWKDRRRNKGWFGVRANFYKNILIVIFWFTVPYSYTHHSYSTFLRWDKQIQKKAKVTTIKTYFIPTIKYGCETWNITEQEDGAGYLDGIYNGH